MQYLPRLCSLLLIIAVIPNRLLGQFVPDQPTSGQQLSLKVDRDTTLVFQKFRRAMSNQRWADARNELERLWTADPEVLVEDRDRPGMFLPLYLAVHRAADPLLEEPAARVMPNTDPERWQVRIGAAEKSEFPKLALEAAGSSAAALPFILLARTQHSRGFPAEANRTLKLIAPNAARAAGVVIHEIQSPPSKPIDVPSNSQFAVPKTLVWDHRALIPKRLRTRIQNVIKAAIEQPQGAFNSTWRTVVHENDGFSRTITGLACHDIKTGKKRWEYPVDDNLQNALRVGNTNQYFGGRRPLARGVSLDSGTADLLFRNRQVGRSVADHRHVYLMVSENQFQPLSIVLSAFPSSSKSSLNRLVALEKTTGRRVWSFGASALRAAFGPSESDGWVMGLPLVLGRNLYVVVEWQGELRLCCLESDSGELSWSTIIAYPEQTIDRDTYRRQLGLTPVAKDGLIYCLTGSGYLCCVDSLSHGLRYITRVLKKPVNIEQGPVARRGQLIRLTVRRPMGQSWNEGGLLFVGDRLIATADQQHTLAILDPATGELILNEEARPGEFIVATTESDLILANEQMIRLIDATTGKQQWSVSINTDERPSGTGVVVGQRFVYAAVNGTLISLNLNDDGREIERTDSILPAQTCGNLQLLGTNDLLFDSPARQIRLSTKVIDKVHTDPLDLANQAIRENDFAEAIAILETSIESETRPAIQQEMEDLLFSCRLQMSLASSEIDRAFDKPELRDSQKLIIDTLKLKVALENQQTETVRSQILKLLLRSGRELGLPAPVIGINQTESQDNQPHAQLSLLAHCMNALSEHLRTVPAAEDEIQFFNEISDEALLNLQHPAAVPLLRNRVKSKSFQEVTLHLVLHSIELAARFQLNSTFEAEWFANRLQEYNAQSGRRRIIWLALQCVLARQSDSFRQQVAAQTNVLSAEELAKQHRHDLQEYHDQWTANSYSVIPLRVNRSLQSRSNRLFPDNTDDPLLREYHVKTTPVDVGRLVMQSVTRQGDRLTLSASLDLGRSYTTSHNTIGRIGSTLLIRSHRNIAAISLIDQQELWSRQSNTSVSFSSRRSNFTNFQNRQTQTPFSVSQGTWQIVGHGQRWFGLMHDRTFQIVDTLTGRNLWTMTFHGGRPLVVATDDYVLVQNSRDSDSIQCFDRRTGLAIDLKFPKTALQKVIRNVGSEIVMWRDSSLASPAALLWLTPEAAANSESMEPMKTVPLNGLTHFRFLDQTTLVGFNKDHEIGIIDLLSGDKTDFKLKPIHAKQLPVLDLAYRALATDGLHYFVFNDKALSPVLQPWGRRTSMATGLLSAIDRLTGKTVWATKLSENTVLTTDQPELGLLILVNSNQAQSDDNKRAQLRGLRRRTGEVVFEHSVPIDSVLRTLVISSRKPNSLVITAHQLQIAATGKSPDSNDQQP